ARFFQARDVAREVGGGRGLGYRLFLPLLAGLGRDTSGEKGGQEKGGEHSHGRTRGYCLFFAAAVSDSARRASRSPPPEAATMRDPAGRPCWGGSMARANVRWEGRPSASIGQKV